MLRPLFVCVLLLLITSSLRAAEGDPSFEEKRFDQLSDRAVSALGVKALAIRPDDWKHGETQNFIYHYRTEAIVLPVVSEAEFYYRVIARELEKDTTQWERKCHIFLFEDDQEWAQFRQVGGLEPWTGGIHSHGELFVPRTRKGLFKGNTLAHELTHLIVHRFFGSGVPLWLNEGLAEYTATRWYASYWRSRGYLTHPRSHSTAPENYISVPELTDMVSYPADQQAVTAFYFEAERLVRLLTSVDKHHFSEFLENMGHGARFESALDRSFGTRFFSVQRLDEEFKPYSAKDYVEPQN